MDAFVLKKIVSNMVHVVPGAFMALLLCIALLSVIPRLARAGLLVITLSLLAISSPVVSNRIVDTLEERYSVVQSLPEDTALVIVLGLGHHWVPGRPPNSVLMARALSRVSEGVRLWQTLPRIHLMLSGARFLSDIPHAEAMSNMALALGVQESRMVLAPETLDTHDEIDAAVTWMQRNADAGGRLVVVSSAVHLSRAEAMLKDRGVEYSMAPTDFRHLDAPWYRFNSRHLYDVDWALHEYVGMLWNRLTS